MAEEKAGTREKPEKRPADEGFKAVGGELQTDETFDSEIIDRMGGRFYDETFAPAIKAAVESGKKTRTSATRSGRTGSPAGNRDGGEQNSPPSMLVVLAATARGATSSDYRAILNAAGTSSARSWRRG